MKRPEYCNIFLKFEQKFSQFDDFLATISKVRQIARFLIFGN